MDVYIKNIEAVDQWRKQLGRTRIRKKSL